MLFQELNKAKKHNPNFPWRSRWKMKLASSMTGVNLEEVNFIFFNLIIFQQDATYSVYYITVGSSTCFVRWHPSSGARKIVNIPLGVDKQDVLPSALVEQWERMAVDLVNHYQKLYLQLYELRMIGVNTRNM